MLTIRKQTMRNIRHLVIMVLPLSGLVACGISKDDEFIYKNSNQEQHIEHFIKLLDQRGIPYKYTNGIIRYKRNVKEEFENAERALDSATSVQFVKSEVREHFHNILSTKGLEYLELDRDYGSWTMWWPESEEIKMIILNQVTEYKITLQQEEASDCASDSSEAPANPSFIQDALNRRIL